MDSDFSLGLRNGVIGADFLREYVAATNATATDVLTMAVELAKSTAVVPISGFLVGAVAVGAPKDDDGISSLYLGSNMEFEEGPLSLSIHAEQAAINSAWLHGEPSLQLIAVSAAPCGHCRQFMAELAMELPIQVLGQPRTGLSGLLPHAFGPADLGVEGGLLKSGRTKLRLDSEPADALIATALDAAELSYAPYTRNHAGCAIESVDGHVVTGRIAESAAYNPTFGPVQSALSQLRLGGIDPREIQRVVLVEAQGKVSQKIMARLILRSVAPQVDVEYVAAGLA